MTTAQDRVRQRARPSPSGQGVAGVHTVVLGLGNTLLGDDGAGVATIDRLRDRDLANVELLDGGTLNFTLLSLLDSDHALIVVDAAQLDAPPGTVRTFVGADMDSFLRRGRCGSIHEVSLSELLDMARLTGNLPRQRALVAIQPEQVDWSPDLTGSVMAGVGEAAEQALHLIREFQA